MLCHVAIAVGSAVFPSRDIFMKFCAAHSMPFADVSIEKAVLAVLAIEPERCRIGHLLREAGGVIKGWLEIAT